MGVVAMAHTGMGMVAMLHTGMEVVAMEVTATLSSRALLKGHYQAKCQCANNQEPHTVHCLSHGAFLRAGRMRYVVQCFYYQKHCALRLYCRCPLIIILALVLPQKCQPTAFASRTRTPDSVLRIDARRFTIGVG